MGRERKNELWRLRRGANVVPGGVHFAVWAPRAERMSVRLLGANERGVRGSTGASGGSGRSGRSGTNGTHELRRKAGGVFEGTVRGAAAGDDYVYVLAEQRERPDPVSRYQPHGVHGASRVVDPDSFDWTDRAWTGLEMSDMIIYELHVGTFTARGTFDAVIPELDRLKELGITAIELMPVSQFPGNRNWGYDGVHHYAPQNSYGGPDGLKRLVDAAHARRLAVVLDVVYNHLGPEGNYLGEYGDYFTDVYSTPWGSAINYDGAESDEVRRWAIDNALYWITEFHIDSLRLDAVHGIFDMSARHILRDLAESVHTQADLLGRSVTVIAESDLNDPKLVSPADLGGYGLDAQWSDDFHHAVHAVLTGERDGYYIGYSRVGDLAKVMECRFVFDGIYSEFRRRRHGAPALHVPTNRFVVAIQNHDQVGNRAAGERLTSLVSFEQLKIAAALMFMSPYVPLLFMGEEYGETNPFQYFVSHSDAELVRAVRDGRRREFEAFAWTGEVPDPQAEDTFQRSRLDRSHRDSEQARQLEALYAALIRLRHAEPALRPGNATVRVASNEEDACLVVELAALDGYDLVALYNLSAEPRQLRIENAKQGSWCLQLATTDARFGGRGGAPRVVQSGSPAERRIDVASFTAALYRLEND